MDPIWVMFRVQLGFFLVVRQPQPSQAQGMLTLAQRPQIPMGHRSREKPWYKAWWTPWFPQVFHKVFPKFCFLTKRERFSLAKNQPLAVEWTSRENRSPFFSRQIGRSISKIRVTRCESLRILWPIVGSKFYHQVWSRQWGMGCNVWSPKKPYGHPKIAPGSSYNHLFWAKKHRVSWLFMPSYPNQYPHHKPNIIGYLGYDGT